MVKSFGLFCYPWHIIHCRWILGLVRVPDN